MTNKLNFNCVMALIALCLGGCFEDGGSNATTQTQAWANPVKVKLTTQLSNDYNGYGTNSATATALFDPADATTFNFSEEKTITDSAGAEHVVIVFYQRLKNNTGANTNSWNAFIYLDPALDGTDTDITGNSGTGGTPIPSVINFDPHGHLISIVEPDGTTIADDELLAIYNGFGVDYTAYSIAVGGNAQSIKLLLKYSRLQQTDELPPEPAEGTGNFVSISQIFDPTFNGFGTNSSTATQLFDPSNPATCNFTLTKAFTDSLGAAHTYHLFYQRISDATGANSNSWNAYVYLDPKLDGTDVDITGNSSDSGRPVPRVLNFDGTGTLATIENPDGTTVSAPATTADYTAYDIDPGGGAVTLNLSIKYDSLTTQMAYYPGAPGLVAGNPQSVVVTADTPSWSPYWRDISASTAAATLDLSNAATFSGIQYFTVLDSLRHHHAAYVIYQKIVNASMPNDNQIKAYAFFDPAFDGTDVDVSGNAGTPSTPMPSVFHFDAAGQFVSMTLPNGASCATQICDADYSLHDIDPGTGAEPINITIRYQFSDGG